VIDLVTSYFSSHTAVIITTTFCLCASLEVAVTLCDVVMVGCTWPRRAVGRVVHDREGHMDITVDVIYFLLLFDTVNKR